MKSKVVLLSSFVALLPLLSPGFDLVKDGKAAEIVLPEKPHPSTLLAAQELADYTEKVTGKKPAVVKGKSQAASKVIIGTLDTLKDIPASAVKALKEAKQLEAHFICARGNTLYIIGKQEVADLYATYQFIEDKLGVRWLTIPDKEDEGEVVPKKAEITFPDYEKFREPAFAIRRLNQCYTDGSVIPVQGKTWATRVGYQTPPPYAGRVPYDKPESARYKFYAPRIPHTMQSLGGGHLTFAGPMPAKTTFEKHPEYFALIDGKRVKGNQYCISNPEVRKNAADSIIRKLDENKGLGHFKFGMVDVNGGWCECPECKKLDGSDTTARGVQNVSTRFQKTVRAIAEMVYAKYPDAELRTWAYHTYREIPDGVTIHPKMIVQFCIHGRCYGHRLDDPDCPRNVSLYKLLLDWLKLAPGRVYEDEFFTPSWAFYSCEELVEGKDLLLYKKLGLIGYQEEFCFPDGKFNPRRKNAPINADWMYSNWQWAYAMGKLLWDPEQDLDKLLDGIESLYYGKAYPAMKKYHALRRKLWSGTPRCLGYPHGDGRIAYILNVPGSREELNKLLDEAEKLSEGDKQLLYRIGKDRRYLKDYWIKANDKLKETATKVMHAPTATSKVVIDGDGKDRAWVGAYYLTSGLKQTDRPEKKDIPAALQTTLGILSDSDNLYFLITAMEPKPDKMKVNDKTGSAVWGKDGVEIFLHPPTASNNCYHLGINPNGTFCDALDTEADGKSISVPVEVKTKILKDRYVIEARVPLAKLKKPERGEIWHIHFARNRKVDDEFTPAKVKDSGFFSIDGNGYHNATGYRPLVIGTPYLRNGSFEELDKNGKPKFWVMRKSQLLKTENGNAIKVIGTAFQYLTDRELWQKPYERKVAYSFTASGKGKISVYFHRDTDTPDPKAPHGYRRKHHGVDHAGTYTLKETPQVFSGEYTIKANEWGTFAFIAKEAIVDDVSLRLVK